MIGSQLSHYQITRHLGSGGMGDVYQATDSKLGRSVAVKFLPEAFATDPDRVSRFEREARLLAALNHSNIATIYGIEQANERKFIVMELVGGETLAERIQRGAIALDEALPIAKQIVEALEAAHNSGVIHRDLKPANIKITPDGRVKVLDFGLAKAAADMDQSLAHMSHSPTMMSAASTPGMIVGTAPYMSPEQAKGRQTDKRSDIWAFGCVLFEMLSGARPFSGESVSEVLASIMKDEPPWTLLPEATPTHIRRLLRRSLAKDPRTRLRDIGDAQFELNEPPVTESIAPGSEKPGKLRIWIPAAALILGVALTAVYFRATAVQPTATTSRLMITPSAAAAMTVTGGARDLAISPDGKRVAYVGGNGTALFVRELDRLDSVRIYEGGKPYNPFFSPDGAWVAFADGITALRRAPVTGGPSEVICRLTAPGGQGTWGADGTIVLAIPNSGLLRVPATGGKPEQIATPDTAAGEAVFAQPQWLPNNRTILFLIGLSNGQASIGGFDLQTGKKTVILRDGEFLRYLHSGHLLYRAGKSWRAVAFDADKLQTSGTPITINEPVYTPTFGGTTDFDVSDNGTLIYVRDDVQAAARKMVWVHRNGVEDEIPLPIRAYTYPTIAADGKQAALDIRDQENDIWIWDFSRSALRRLTFDPGYNQYAVWAPDSKHLVNYFGGALLWKQADGAGASEELLATPFLKAPSSISPDGTRLLYREDHPETGNDVMMLTLDASHKVQPLLQTNFNELNADVSPDGRWVAFESDESGSYQVYVRPFPEVNAGRWQVSTNGGTKPLWSKDRKELFYIAPDGALMSAKLEPGATFAAAAPTKLLEGRYYVGTGNSLGRTYDASADGQRFLMIKPDIGPPASMIVVTNWFSELQR